MTQIKCKCHGELCNPLGRPNTIVSLPHDPSDFCLHPSSVHPVVDRNFDSCASVSAIELSVEGTGDCCLNARCCSVIVSLHGCHVQDWGFVSFEAVSVDTGAFLGLSSECLLSSTFNLWVVFLAVMGP